MMHLTTVMCLAICLIFVQIISTSATNGEFPAAYNISRSYTSHSNSGRSKRSLFEKMPKTLRIRVRYVTGEEIDLEWTKQVQHLVNQYLPVITSSGYPLPTAMDDVGEVVLYQDPGKCSAVVYFEKFHTLFGVIGMNYYVADLPYLFDVNGNYPIVVREPFVKKREYSPVHNLPQIPDSFLQQLVNPLSSDPYESSEPSFESYPGPSSKRQRTERNIDHRNNEILTSTNVSKIGHIRERRYERSETYHLEILTLVTKDVAEIFKRHWGDRLIEWLVRYYIIYFNAVDMMFRKLNNRVALLLINIAKIVIEDEVTPFDFISNNGLEYNLPQYLNSHQHEYPRIRSTMYSSSPGLSYFDADLYEARKRGEFYNAVPKTLIGFDEHFTSAVHEIAKTFKFPIDSWHDGDGELGQCSSLMQEGSSKCDKCLKWSPNSQQYFDKFFNIVSEERHRCFLLNPPRSVRPPGPSQALSPNRQCWCYGYGSYFTLFAKSKSIIPAGTCSQPLQCTDIIEGHSFIRETIPPLDGTLCGIASKVCWNGQCIKFHKEYDWHKIFGRKLPQQFN